MAQESSDMGGSSLLEQFRQEWRNEVSARSKKQTQKSSELALPKQKRRRSTVQSSRPINKLSARVHQAGADDDDDYHAEPTSSELIEQMDSLTVKEVDQDTFPARIANREPESALDHYEKAVEKESEGNLGDSLSLYRKAYRLDAKVDQSYRNKHFPNRWKPSQADTSQAQNTIPTVASHEQQQQTNQPVSFDELIISYAGLSIPGAQSIIEGDAEPPCPIRKLPTEVLMELLLHVAINDPSVFARLALVCKRFAYHVFTENSIWKRIALGSEFGLASQVYSFITDVQGRESIFRVLEDEEESAAETSMQVVDERIFSPDTNYRKVFHSHPRIRFSGVYIATVNYTRAGGVSATPGTWASTVHIVTYYRYLRFFRDGTLISLLTTNEPIDVVHHLTKENLALVRPLGKNAPNPSHLLAASKDTPVIPATTQNVMKYALRGRWRLCHPSLSQPSEEFIVGENMGQAGDIHLETEGAAPRYTYTIHLSLKSTSRSQHTTKNNKLIWKGFWIHNRLTDDWAEFPRKNDTAFIFSRVKSYGFGF